MRGRGGYQARWPMKRSSEARTEYVGRVGGVEQVEKHEHAREQHVGRRFVGRRPLEELLHPAPLALRGRGLRRLALAGGRGVQPPAHQRGEEGEEEGGDGADEQVQVVVEGDGALCQRQDSKMSGRSQRDMVRCGEMR